MWYMILATNRGDFEFWYRSYTSVLRALSDLTEMLLEGYTVTLVER